jgi:hypothetical protein
MPQELLQTTCTLIVLARGSPLYKHFNLPQAMKQSPFGKVNVFTTVWLTK